MHSMALRLNRLKATLEAFSPRVRCITTTADNLQRPLPVSVCPNVGETDDILYGPDHYALKASLRKIIENDINPYVEEWEAAKMFPAHKVFKKLGENGFLGVTKPKKIWWSRFRLLICCCCW